MAGEPRSVRSVTRQTHGHVAARPRAQGEVWYGGRSQVLSVLCRLVLKSVLLDIWLSDGQYV